MVEGSGATPLPDAPDGSSATASSPSKASPQAPSEPPRIAAAAGIATGGVLGIVRVEALAVLVAQVSRTWLDDADPDLAATMKALDTALERAERWANRSLPGR